MPLVAADVASMEVDMPSVADTVEAEAVMVVGAGRVRH